MIHLLKYNSSSNNVVDVLLQFLKISHIKVDADIVEDEILNHPEYPMLTAVADFFQNYDIEYAAFSPTIEQLMEVFNPCITQIKLNGQMYFSVIKYMDRSSVKYYDPNQHRYKKISIVEFKKIYQNVAFMIEEQATLSLPPIKRKSVHNYISRILLLVCLPFAISVFSFLDFLTNGQKSSFYLLYNLLSYIGLIIASFLVYYEIDNNNLLFRKVCGKNNSKTDCNAVLQSNGATIFGIKFTYMGFCYFAALLIVAVFSNRSTYLNVFLIVSLCVSPFVLYSIFYQGAIVKSWCKFCLAIQAILLLQSLLYFLKGDEYQVNNGLNVANSLLLFFISGLFVYIGLINLVPIFRSALMLKHVKIAYQKAKFSNNAFWNQLESQEVISFEGFECLQFNKNKNAENTITVVCNPFCSHCADAHNHIEKLYNQGKINFNLLFISSVDETDIRYLPVKHLLAIARRYDEKTFLEAVHDWYTTFKQNYHDFKSKYPTPEIDTSLLDAQIDAMKTWSVNNEIQVTPTIFINKHYLPEAYPINELKFAFF